MVRMVHIDQFLLNRNLNAMNGVISVISNQKCLKVPIRPFNHILLVYIVRFTSEFSRLQHMKKRACKLYKLTWTNTIALIVERELKPRSYYSQHVKIVGTELSCNPNAVWNFTRSRKASAQLPSVMCLRLMSFVPLNLSPMLLLPVFTVFNEFQRNNIHNPFPEIFD